MNVRDRIEGKVFTKTCAFRRCKKQFETVEPGQKFCSDECKARNAKQRRHSASYHRKNRDVRNFKNTGRRELRKLLEALPVEQRCCEHCGSEQFDGHHCDGDTTNNTDENVLRTCDEFHAITHHPAAFNMWQLGQLGNIIPTMLYCVKARVYVVCTNIKCSGSRHCSGVPANESKYGAVSVRTVLEIVKRLDNRAQVGEL